MQSFKFTASLHKRACLAIARRKGAGGRDQGVGDAFIWPKRACAAEPGMVFKVSLES